MFGTEQVADDKGVNDLKRAPAFPVFMFIHLSVASLGSSNVCHLQLGLERVHVRIVGRERQRCVAQTKDTVKLLICWDVLTLFLNKMLRLITSLPPSGRNHSSEIIYSVTLTLGHQKKLFHLFYQVLVLQ